MKITATIGDKKIIWNDGFLSGDEVIVKMIESEAKALEGENVGFPSATGTTTNHLSDPYSFMVLAEGLYFECIFSGDIPVFEDVEEGKKY